MSIILGIDPGKDGAVVGLQIGAPTSADDVTIWRTRDYLVPTGKGAKREYDEQALATLIRNLDPGFIELAVIEAQQPFPHMSAATRGSRGHHGSFSIGVGYGLWRGLFAGLGVPVRLVHPRTWTAQMLRGAPGEGKARARAVASRLLPRLVIPRGKGGEGVADAACLALYGLTLLGRKGR